LGPDIKAIVSSISIPQPLQVHSSFSVLKMNAALKQKHVKKKYILMTNDMPKYFRFSQRRTFLLFVVIDIVCIGCGMGIPVFNIIFGFIVGWYLVRWMLMTASDQRRNLFRLMRYSCMTALVTFAGMVVVWGWSIPLIFKSEADIVNFGIPLILFEPRASLIGWLILMIVISPFLQLLTTIFSGHLTLMFYDKKKETQDMESKTTT
jgi:hypothetical protein